MDEDKNKLKNITLESNELNLNNVEDVYDQDIGEEYEIVLEEVKYEEPIDIDEVEPPKEEVKVKKDKKDETFKSDKRIIKIAGIIALILVIIVIVLLTTRKKVEKGHPVIKLVGDETIVLELGNEYKDMGYFALDQEDGDITDRVNVIGEVNTAKPGVYQVKYKVLDTDRIKTEVYRTIIVKSKTNEFDFKLEGDDIVFINPNKEYIEEGYTASYKNENVSSEVKKFGSINRSVPGNYNLFYVLEKDEQVAVLKRTVIVYKGEEMGKDADLITELNNWIIDEVHYSNKISMDNVSTSVLLYFGVLNCHNDRTIIPYDDLNECLSKILNVDKIKIPTTTKYQGKRANITYNQEKQSWIVNKLDLPNPKEDLYKVVLDGNTIYLYELYGYEVLLNNREVCDGNDNKIYYSGVDRNTLLGYESCKIVTCETESCDNIVRTKKYKLALYLHTFKLSNGKYYWSSTEMIK